ncbi:hypothetical protein [Phenylobacterium sp.]|uniref:hypothetical protein n=1 Tax=Phenylobacterium sp. TaxID=1871053 RepID=UPI002611A51B|nr:hypothetical protein [Phenylobacterium sp.]
MSKKSKKVRVPAPPPPTRSRWQWVTKPWALAVAVGAALGAVLLNINPILSNVRQLPSEVQKTSDQFSSWYYQDAAWSGRWINDPEGYVDGADLNLSSERMAIDMNVTNGIIGGTIATPQICDAIPFFDFRLIRGRVNATRTSARVVVWDIFEGHRRDVAAVDLKLDGSVMTVVPKEGSVTLFPAKARIAFDPGETPSAPFCEGRQAAIERTMEEMLKARQTTAP